MTPAEAILLALFQGVTEFLPISSSAHLILVPYVLGWEAHNLRFDVVTNAGTLLAAMVYFRADLAAAVRQMLGGGRGASPQPTGGAARPTGDAARPGLGPAVLVASIPVMVVGFLFYDWFATDAREPRLIAATSILFGVLLWWADRAAGNRRRLEGLRWRDCVWIGFAQALALVPGTSRSGVTITAGLFLGLERSAAARFSFLLAIPVGIVALAKDLLELLRGGEAVDDLRALAIGFVTSAVSAYVVIGWILAWLRRQNLTVFVVYRVLLGLLILALASTR